MGKAISVRFYRIGKVSAQGSSLRDTLTKIYNLGEPSARECQLDGSFVCRLERLELEKGIISGEMVRIRNTDRPCEVHPGGTKILGVKVPLGEGIAFRYREADHVLAIQYDVRTVSPGRFNDYLQQMHNAGKFHFTPVIDPEALAKFQDQPLRKVKIKLARPADLSKLEDHLSAAGEAFRSLGEAYDAPEVTIQLSMGRNKGQLAEGTKSVINGLLTMAGHSSDVRGITVTPDAGEGLRNEDINLLDSLLSEKGDVAPLSDAPDDVYQATSLFVRIKLNSHG